MKVKPITSIETALQIYYTYPEIGNREIKVLFGSLGDATLRRYKKAVEIVQSERDIIVSRHFSVNTQIAYEVWGIDVKDLEIRRAKLKQLGFAM